MKFQLIQGRYEQAEGSYETKKKPE